MAGGRAAAMALGSLGAAWVNRRILSLSAPFIFTWDELPPRPIGLILGARVPHSGRPTATLIDRLESGRALLQAQKVKRLLLSGEGRGGRRDEITAMKRHLSEHGVPPEALCIDRYGIRTYMSVLRARDTFGISALTITTCAFHLPRAIYIARALGLDAVGIAAKPLVSRKPIRRWKNETREAAARVRAFVDIAGQEGIPVAAGFQTPRSRW